MDTSIKDSGHNPPTDLPDFTDIEILLPTTKLISQSSFYLDLKLKNNNFMSYKFT